MPHQLQNLVKKSILDLRPYQPGKSGKDIGNEKAIKLASNENPIGVSPKATEVIKSCLKNIYRYPPDAPFSLREKIARKYGVGSENIILGNGSDEIIELIVKAFLNPAEEVILSEPDFLIYKLSAQAAGAKIASLPSKDFKTDLKRIKSSISNKTKLIFLSNPNNPLGSYLNQDEVKDFFNNLSKDIIIVFDQAYAEFVETEDYPQMLESLDSHNLILLRTFSKFYGLAGLRIGYAISNSRFIEYLNKVRLPFNVNFLAQQAASAVWNDKLFLKKTKEVIKEGKEYIYKSLNKLNLFCIDSATNFISIDVQEDGQTLCQKMFNYGIIVRDLKPYGLDNFVRVTIGQEEENKRFIEAMTKIKKENSSI
ncbi:MAG: histidinol-phosphate transaminase [Candidatus Omnitrophica bacterium]|nr:histidinol-phosphate transaminase [Candidatus Omnitrophota bacterium]